MEEEDYEVNIPFKMIKPNDVMTTKLIEISDEDKMYLPNYDEIEKSFKTNLYKIKVYGLNDNGVYLFIARDEYREIDNKYYCFIYAVKYGKIMRKIGILETINKEENIEKLNVGFINFFPFYYLDTNKKYLIELEQDIYSYVIHVINNKEKEENGKSIGTNIITDIWKNSFIKVFNIKSESGIIKNELKKILSSDTNKENKLRLLKEVLMKFKEKIEETDDYEIIDKYFNINNYFPYLKVLKKFDDTKIPDEEIETTEPITTNTSKEKMFDNKTKLPSKALNEEETETKETNEELEAEEEPETKETENELEAKEENELEAEAEKELEAEESENENEEENEEETENENEEENEAEE